MRRWAACLGLLALAWGESTPAARPERGPLPKGVVLRVRILGRSHPTRAWIRSNASTLVCDDVPLDVRDAEIRMDADRLDVGRPGLRCRRLWALGDGVTVRIDGSARHYRGSLRATVLDGEIALFNDVDVESYVRGVVGSEQLHGALEAIKAQAVVSRTYATQNVGRHANAGYDLCDLTHCQLYRGRSAESHEGDVAVRATRGEILRKEDKPVAAFFHSTCGGATSSTHDVFGTDDPSPGVRDGDGTGILCLHSPFFQWSWEVTRMALAEALGVPARGKSFGVVSYDASGRALRVRAFGVEMTGEDFHARVGRAFGYQSLKSLKLTAVERGDRVRFDGQGMGHGVGLCQHGAYELARRGRTYREILAHYFSGSTVERMER